MREREEKAERERDVDRSIEEAERGCCGLNVCVPPDSYFEVLMPDRRVLGGGAFGKCLALEDGFLTDGVSTYDRDVPRLPKPLPPSELQ